MPNILPQSRTELLSMIAEDQSLRSILEEVRKNDDGDAAHDPSHLLRVALWTLRFGEGRIDIREAVAAALLHDFVNVPKNHPDRAKASTFSAEKAATLLAQLDFSSEAIARVAAAIRDHSFSRGARPTELLGQALQDADRLEAIGAIGLMRVFATGARMNTGFFDPEDPWAKARPLDDMKFSVDHFFTKLLRLPSSFLTAAGRAEAEKRVGGLHRFLDDLAEELGEPRP